MLAQETINEIYNKFWMEGFRSITAIEVGFIQEIIFNEKPRRVIEIGTATGLSTGFIALFLESSGGKELYTIDLDNSFWGDRNKPIGFLSKEIYTGKKVDVKIIHKADSAFACKNFSDLVFDMAFIDANHQQPWPTIDMIATLPIMAKGAQIIHHDLSIYKHQTPIYGVGPKYLFDQIPDHLITVISDNDKNIFSIKNSDNYCDFEEYLINSLYLPWTNRKPITAEKADEYSAIIEKYWSTKLVDAFKETWKKFNKPISDDSNVHKKNKKKFSLRRKFPFINYRH